MKKKLAMALLAAALPAAALVGAGAAYAHHAFAAEFDADAPVLLKGKVTRVEWVNPHTWIHIQVPDTDKKGQPKKGMTTTWMVEGGTPNTLKKTGIKPNSLAVGTEIVVRGYQSKDALCSPECKANGRDVTFPDGRKLFVGSSGTGAPTDGSDPDEKKKP